MKDEPTPLRPAWRRTWTVATAMSFFLLEVPTGCTTAGGTGSDRVEGGASPLRRDGASSVGGSADGGGPQNSIAGDGAVSPATMGSTGARDGGALEAGPASASDGGSLPPVTGGSPLTGPLVQGEMTWYRVTLQGGHLDQSGQKGSDLRMLVQRIGNEVTVVSFGSEHIGLKRWGMVKPTLTASPTKLGGAQMIWEGDITYPLVVDGVIDGRAVRGTYLFQRSKAKHVKAGRSFPGLQDVGGPLTGEVIPEVELARSNAISPQASWDNWVGPHGNFSGQMSAGGTLLDDLSQAKVVWRSETMMGTEHGSCRYGVTLDALPGGMGASPILHRGRVIAFHQVPTPESKKMISCFAGELATYGSHAQAIGYDDALLNAPYWVGTDEVALGIDAATGRTLWRVRFPNEGLNLFDHKASITNHTGTAGDGRVFVFGGLGILRALDVETGQVLWTANVPGYHETMSKVKSMALTTGEIPYLTRSFAHGLNYVAGVVIAPTGRDEAGLAGFDGETGAMLWKTATTVLGSKQTPLRWRTGGKDYVVAVTSLGKVTAWDPLTGKLLWEGGAATRDDSRQSVIEGDRLVTTGGMFELSASGTSRKWGLPCLPNAKATGVISGGKVWIRCNTSSMDPGQLIGLDLLSGREVIREPKVTGNDEAHAFAMGGRLFFEPDSQHGYTRWLMFPDDVARWGQMGTTYTPPLSPETTYTVPLSHAVADGRIFVRGNDGIYCIDARK